MKKTVWSEYDSAGKIIWEFDVHFLRRNQNQGMALRLLGIRFILLSDDNGNTLIGTGNGHSVLEVTSDKEIIWKLDQYDLPGITLPG